MHVGKWAHLRNSQVSTRTLIVIVAVHFILPQTKIRGNKGIKTTRKNVLRDRFKKKVLKNVNSIFNLFSY